MFRNLHRNAVTCLAVEPLWILPNSLYATYTAVYMYALGVSDTGIGLLTSIGLVLQILTSIISGDLTDRLGRRWALFIFDLVSWTCATFIWAISQNFWYFLLAAVFNSFQKVPNTAWYCLLVEDTPGEHRSQIFTVLQWIGVVGGLLAPIGGLMVSHFGLVHAMRYLYILACVSMTLMNVIRHFGVRETSIGKLRKEQAGALHLGLMMRQYWQVTKFVLKNGTLRLIFLVYILNNFQITVRSTYLSIYLVQHLHLAESAIAWFPALSSLAMLVLMYISIRTFREQFGNRYMMTGFAVGAAGNLLLAFTPIMGYVVAGVSTVLAAAGTMIATPYLESTVANAIDDVQRARVLSILTVLIMICTSPAGILAGWLYTISAAIPFYLVTAMFLASAVLVYRFSKRKLDGELTVALPKFEEV